MVGDSFLAEGQTAGNVAIVIALSDQQKDFTFAIGQFGKELRRDD